MQQFKLNSISNEPSLQTTTHKYVVQNSSEMLFLKKKTGFMALLVSVLTFQNDVIGEEIQIYMICNSSVEVKIINHSILR